MPPAPSRTHTAAHEDPPAEPTNPPAEPTNPHAPGGGNHPDDAKADSKAAKADSKDKAPSLFVIVAQPREGGQLVELCSEETAAARVSMLTYGSKQHRKEVEDSDETLPDGGGSHEINRRDIHVYKLNATEVTDF